MSSVAFRIGGAPPRYAACLSDAAEAGTRRISFERRRYTAHELFGGLADARMVLVFAASPIRIVDGTGVDARTMIESADIICIAPGPVERKAIDASGMTEMLHVTLPHCALAAAASSLGIDYELKSIRPTLSRLDPHLATLAGNLLQALETAGTLEGPLLDTYARAFAGFIVSQYASALPLPGPARGGLSSRALRLVQEEIEAKVDADLPLARLAEVAGLSTFHFCREFKRTTGVSPRRYVLEARCRQAMRRLESGNERIIDVALACGFKNPQSFARAFRRVVGVTPSTFRRNLTA